MKLPKEVKIFVGDVLDKDEIDQITTKIDDYLADKYGYCVESYCINDIKLSYIEWDTKE